MSSVGVPPVSRANHYSSLGVYIPLNSKIFNNCNNTLCYTHSKGTSIYQPHTAYGMVGRTSAGYLGQRRRL